MPLAQPRLFALLAACLVAASCASTPTASEELRSTVAFLLEVHPRPFAYVEPAALQALVEEESARLDALEDPDDLERGRSFHRVLASLGDIHLALALPVFQLDSSVELSLLPVIPKRAGETIFVDASSEELPLGTELLALDGVPIDELYGSLSPLVLADGRSEGGRRAALERQFALYFHLARGMRPTYNAVIRLPGGEERELTLAGVDRETLGGLQRRLHSAPIWGGPPPETGVPPWPSLARLDDDTVLLRLPSFGIRDHEGYRARVDALFAELDGTDTLVLDLRGNQGGFRTHGIAVLNHILAAPYAQWQRMRTRVRRIPAAYRERVGFPIAPESALSEPFRDAREEDDGFIREGDPLAPLMVPHGDGYDGNVVVLADGLTNSAAVEMISALLASRPDVELIGEETGGECGRHVGEFPVTYTTRGRGLVLLASLFELTHVEVDGCQEGRGYLPDRPVRYDERAFLEQRDPFLALLGLESAPDEGANE